MTKRRITLLAVGLCACTRLPAPTSSEDRADPEDPAPFEESEFIKPCEGETLARARAELEAIEQSIEALAPGDDPEPQWRALVQLFEGECFALSRVYAMDADDEAPSSGLALRTWWGDGGALWAEEFLSLETTWERPSVRVALSPELTPQHPLVDLLCPLAEPDCDPQTRGWTLRAKQAFEDHAERRWARYRSGDEALPGVRDSGECETLAMSKPEALRYETWLECIDHVSLRRSVFPIGGLKAPQTGWFVVRGPSGRNCEETRAFELATGRVSVTASCSDSAQADTEGEPRTTGGRVPVDALREAVWMALWTTQMPHADQLLGDSGYPIPDAIAVMSREEVGAGVMSATFSSGQTTLEWTYVREGEPTLSGELRRPEDYDDGARDHAGRLLAVAEAAMVEGPVPARPDWLGAAE
ncbi:hypothetical protein G6O69_06710 [Pseudenhygromyxa sp. WMMC2535]|uniref:hypothetical protein n=1 Tax=Pseudenhygromyxa sp. WMMC2535 TaxID=2712867 RepID=UPI001557F31F|nr:hypothetical protein [Pseudenhygromyxa sp. WMMC2535]NVB37517.1 hypothetical protein [Pseudenhygromyxa sp. WMMC2535]